MSAASTVFCIFHMQQYDVNPRGSVKKKQIQTKRKGATTYIVARGHIWSSTSSESTHMQQSRSRPAAPLNKYRLRNKKAGIVKLDAQYFFVQIFQYIKLDFLVIILIQPSPPFSMHTIHTRFHLSRTINPQHDKYICIYVYIYIYIYIYTYIYIYIYALLISSMPVVI